MRHGLWILGSALTLLGSRPASAAESFSAPTGHLGGDLSLDDAQRSRLHAEMSYFTVNSAGATLHALAWKFGGGIKLSDALELSLEVPVGGLITTSAPTSTDQFAPGNLALGVNYFREMGRAFRFKLGGAISFGPWNDSNGSVDIEGLAVGVAGIATHGYQELWLFQPGAVHLVAPARVEIGETLQFTGDFFGQLALPTAGGDVLALLTLAPGIVVWPTEQWTFGARLPIQFLSQGGVSGDQAQVDLEPFLRFNFGSHAFLSTRLTVHLDDDLGFSFDSGKFWGLHLGAGGAF